ncbi:MAG: SMI1/KNR4 family protein [Armatimonadota bacterium]
MSIGKEFHVASEVRESGLFVVVTHRATGTQRIAGPVPAQDAGSAAERLTVEIRADLERFELSTEMLVTVPGPEEDARWLRSIQRRIRVAGQDPAPPATPDELAAAEAKLGFSLPPTLRLLYLRVGNGGFGPGYGLMGVAEGAADDEGETVETWYARRRAAGPDEAGWRWPHRLLPLCSYGCAIYCCVDAASPEEPVLRFDPSEAAEEGAYEDCLSPEGYSLRAWMADWAAGWGYN